MTNKRPTLHSHLTQLVCMLIVNMFVASFPAMASEIVRVGVTHFPLFMTSTKTAKCTDWALM